MNMGTGDVFTERIWRPYYNLEEKPKFGKILGKMIGNKGGVNDGPKYGHFEVGSVIGMLVDLNLGRVNFYKDGYDLGVAFISGELTEPDPLFPFIQVQEVCKVSLYHPFGFPGGRVTFRPPISVIVSKPKMKDMPLPPPPRMETPKKRE